MTKTSGRTILSQDAANRDTSILDNVKFCAMTEAEAVANMPSSIYGDARSSRRVSTAASACGFEHCPKSVEYAIVIWPRPRRARHVVLVRHLADRDDGVAGGDGGAGAVLSVERAGHGVRHHLLLGRADDDDADRADREGAVRGRLHPCPRARREGQEDVQVAGQRARSDRADRRVRGGRGAVHADGDGGDGAGPEAQPRPDRGVSQLRDEALERGAVRGDERLRAGCRVRSGAR